MDRAVYTALKKHIDKDMSSFHTPGHKSAYFGEYYRDFFEHIIYFDLTELDDTDNLLEHNGAISQSEKVAASVFGSKASLFSTFGCTLCIQTMIRLATLRSKKIIAHRCIHKSAVNTFALLGIDVLWLNSDKNGLISTAELTKAIEENPDAGAVYITSPDYYGLIQNTEKIADICHKNDRLLIVDNAHGSHLYFVDNKLKHSLQKADMLACSLHKTLPVMTGGAVLNINNEHLVPYAKDAMKLFSGTSPSYPILVSIDLCMDMIKNKNEFFLKPFADKISKIKLRADKANLLKKGDNIMFDPLRITLDSERLGISGFDLADVMRNYKIEPEFSDISNVVLITTPNNRENDFNRLCHFFDDFENIKGCMKAVTDKTVFCTQKPVKAFDIRKALMSEYEEVDIQGALMRIAFESICNYPPGIPLILPGEVITDNIIKVCLENRINRVKVVKNVIYG